MSRGRNILLFALLPLAIIIGVTYYLTTTNKSDAPYQEEIQLVESVKVDPITTPKVDSIVVEKIIDTEPKPIKKNTSEVIESEIEEEAVVEDSVKIDFGSVGELITESQQEIKNIDKQDFIFEQIDLPEVSHRVVLKYQRVDPPTLFVPKGQWLFGGTMQYSDHTNVNYKLLVLDDWEGRGYTVSGKIYVGYAIKDNLALGVRAGFGRTLLNIDNLNLSLGDDLNFNIDHAHYINQQWSGSFFMRNFFSLFGSRQFGLFNDTEITFAGGRGKTITGTGEMLKGTYQTSFDASIGISPGIMVFMQNIAAIELSVGLLGFSTSITKQQTNQVYEGKRRTSGAKFGVDILSIKLGATFYINSRQFKQR